MAGTKKIEYIYVISRLVFLGVGLGVMVWVIVQPALAFAPVPRVMLFALVGIVLGILFGSEASTKFKLNLVGFSFVTAGASAVVFGFMMIAYHLAKPTLAITVFNVYNEEDAEVNLNYSDVKISSGLTTLTHWVDRNNLVVRFVDEKMEAELEIRASSQSHKGRITYSTIDSVRLCVYENKIVSSAAGSCRRN